MAKRIAGNFGFPVVRRPLNTRLRGYRVHVFVPTLG